MSKQDSKKEIKALVDQLVQKATANESSSSENVLIYDLDKTSESEKEKPYEVVVKTVANPNGDVKKIDSPKETVFFKKVGDSRFIIVIVIVIGPIIIVIVIF